MNAHRHFFNSASVTHKGMVRQLNEDSFISRDDLGLWAVADGMGGHQAGEIASQQITQSLGSIRHGLGIDELFMAAKKALENANAQLISMADQFDDERPPGSTVVALMLGGDRAMALWAGDSRIYHFRNGQGAQITRDHSHVQELVDQNLITLEQAESHPMANVITRAVGTGNHLDLESTQLSIQAGDRFLLCSDGLSRLLSFDEIRNLMQAGNLQECVQSLLHTALVRGAPDNVTIVTVECCDQAEQEDDRTAQMPRGLGDRQAP